MLENNVISHWRDVLTSLARQISITWHEVTDTRRRLGENDTEGGCPRSAISDRRANIIRADSGGPDKKADRERESVCA